MTTEIQEKECTFQFIERMDDDTIFVQCALTRLVYMDDFVIGAECKKDICPLYQLWKMMGKILYDKNISIPIKIRSEEI